MIEKHLKRYIYICDLPKNFLEAATKENLQTYQGKSRYERKSVLIKLLRLFNYWSKQMEKLIAAVEIFLFT